MIDVLCGGLEWSAGMRVGGGQRIFPVACLSSRFLFRYPGQNISLCESGAAWSGISIISLIAIFFSKGSRNLLVIYL